MEVFPRDGRNSLTLKISLNPRTPRSGSFPSEAPSLRTIPLTRPENSNPFGTPVLVSGQQPPFPRFPSCPYAKEKLSLGWLLGLTYSSLLVEQVCLFTHSFTYQLSFIRDSHPHYQAQWAATWQGSVVLEISRFEQVSCSGGRGRTISYWNVQPPK